MCDPPPFEFALLFVFHTDRSFLSEIFIISKRNQKKTQAFVWQLYLSNWTISNSNTPVAKIPFETIIVKIQLPELVYQDLDEGEPPQTYRQAQLLFCAFADAGMALSK